MTVPPRSGPGAGPEPAPDGTALGPEGDPLDVVAAVGASWLWALGTALVTLIPGILILVWPDETLHVLAVVIGLYLLLGGVFRFVSAFARDAHGERLARVLLAMLFVVAGVLCLRHPLQTIAALSLIVGVTWLVSGILTLYTAIAFKDLAHRGVVFGAGALGVAAGIVVLALPTESAVALTRLLGLWLVLLGLVELAVAFALRSAIRRTRG
ncbi:HdeD family acid-resistance protein [Streptomyces sp. NPDC058964]|uniref:HdeD family acid-resistance protein n=1 Tax=Streptomyces sp. NPDC058964 TaxID=3346681 RepID=UPI003678D94E